MEFFTFLPEYSGDKDKLLLHLWDHATCKMIPAEMLLLTHYCTSLHHPSHFHTHNYHSGQSLLAAGFPVVLHLCSSTINNRRQRAAISQS